MEVGVKTLALGSREHFMENVAVSTGMTHVLTPEMLPIKLCLRHDLTIRDLSLLLFL